MHVSYLMHEVYKVKNISFFWFVDGTIQTVYPTFSLYAKLG